MEIEKTCSTSIELKQIESGRWTILARMLQLGISAIADKDIKVEIRQVDDQLVFKYTVKE